MSSLKTIYKGGLFLVIILGISAGIYYGNKNKKVDLVITYKTAEESDQYVRFEMEAFDKILSNYWKKTNETDLSGLFQLSLQKAGNFQTLPTLASTTRAGTAKMLSQALAQASTTTAKKDLALNTLMVALYNLPPVGRDSLLSVKQEKALRQEVANVNPEKDLYKDLGVEKGASTTTIETAFKEKSAMLAKATTTEAKAELEKVNYAHQVLTSSDNKALYDQGQIEPTVWKHLFGKTVYISMSKISPTTLQEFAKLVDSASTTPNLDSLVLDLRGNIGGALDFAPAFFGLFAGQNQYAFDLFHQDEYKTQRTSIGKFPELEKYKDIAILTDNMTQSTAEVVTAMFKRFKLGRSVGTATRGWGTVEDTVPLETDIDPENKYSMLLVQYLTLRDDGEPIEGKGVSPDVDINDKNWKTNLGKNFRSQSLIDAVLKTAVKPPLR